jgi:nifR3 family TIM-barrel protein
MSSQTQVHVRSLRLGPYQLKAPWILAPMAGVSEMPFRLIVRDMGAGAAPTELVSAKGLAFGHKKSERYLAHDASERPFWVQLFGGEPEAMAHGAERAAELGAEIIDVNMGCPVRKVTRCGGGAALMQDVPRATRIVEAIIARTGLPVTAKLRAGWDARTANAVEVGIALAEAGCAAVAIHARTRAQGYSGQADWSLIARMVREVPLPIIGNGDARTAAQAERMQRETGCAGVMIGRGAMGYPWVFRQLDTGDHREPSRAERWRVVREHLNAHVTFVGNELAAVRRFRPHLMCYARGLRGASAFRREVTRIEDIGRLRVCCETFFEGATDEPREADEPGWGSLLG